MQFRHISAKIHSYKLTQYLDWGALGPLWLRPCIVLTRQSAEA